MTADSLVVVEQLCQLVVVLPVVIHVGIEFLRVFRSRYPLVCGETVFPIVGIYRLLLFPVVFVIKVDVVREIFQEFHLGIPCGEQLCMLVVTAGQIHVPQRVMRLRIFFVGLRGSIHSVIVRIDARNHLLGIETGQRAHIALFPVRQISPDPRTDSEPVGNVGIDIHSSEISLVSGVLYDTWIIDIGQTHVVAHLPALAVDRQGMFLHPFVLVYLIPPVGVRIGYIVRISAVGDAVRILFSLPPLVYRNLREKVGTSYIVG